MVVEVVVAEIAESFGHEEVVAVVVDVGSNCCVDVDDDVRDFGIESDFDA